MGGDGPTAAATKGFVGTLWMYTARGLGLLSHLLSRRTILTIFHETGATRFTATAKFARPARGYSHLEGSALSPNPPSIKGECVMGAEDKASNKIDDLGG